VWRIHPPCPANAAPLFFDAGAPEALEGRGLSAWVQAAFYWTALCERLHERASGWKRIVAHWLVPSALAARAVAPRLPLTAYAHSGDISLLERLPGGPSIARKLARETDDLIFVSANLRARFARMAGRTVGRVARLDVQSAACAPISADPLGATLRDATARTITVLAVGRLVPIKGFDILLRAVAQAVDPRGSTGNEWMTVVILGEGPERGRLKAMAQQLDIDLRLPGCIPRPLVGQWMERASIYVQPSRRLPSGRTEGLPLIVADSGGLSELDGATKFPAEDARALSVLLGTFAPAARAPWMTRIG